MARSAHLVLLRVETVGAGMTPAIAPARMRLAFKIDIAFSRYRNMTRIASRRIYVLGNITTHIEIFIRPFTLEVRALVRNALHVGWLFLCKNCCAKNPVD